MVGIIIRVFGVVLLAGLVVLGIVFIPDEFMARVDSGVASVKNFVTGEVSQRGPQLAQDFSKQTQEARADAQNIYQSLKEKFSPMVGGWIANFFSPPK